MLYQDAQPEDDGADCLSSTRGGATVVLLSFFVRPLAEVLS
jgi:hypothetical protein